MKRAVKIITIYAVIIFAASLGSGMSGRDMSLPRYVQVAIVKSASSVGLRVVGDYIITTLSGAKELFRVPSNKWISVKGGHRGINIGNNILNYNGIRLKSGGRGKVIVEGKHLDGDLFIYLKSDKNLLVVNRLNIEEYLKGVLPFEMSPESPVEALKAQAVAARTYAYYKIIHPQTDLYTLTDDTSSQAYGGNSKHSARVEKAVEETRGMIMTYKGSPFLSFYHTRCGGMTEKAQTVWKYAKENPGNARCRYCLRTPKIWETRVSFWKLAQILQKKGYKVGRIRKIIIGKKDRKSGRVRTVIIYSSKGNVSVPAIDLRNMLGANTIKSTYFSVRNGMKKVLITGKGWGHGVGMCQVGAIAMASDGYTYTKILKHYYPGISLRRM